MTPLLRALLLLLVLLPAALRAQVPDCPPPVEPPSVALAAEGLRHAHDRGFLWRLTKDGRVSYLYGTLHVARRDWVVPGPRVRAALADSDTLALELDMLDPQVARRMAAGIEAPAGAPPLPSALQRRLERRARSDCADPALFARLGPEMKLATLTMLAARRQGLEAAYGVDLFLAGYARSRGQRVVGLETPEEQLAALTSAPDEAVALLDGGLRDLDSGRGQALLARLAQLWADGDHATLAAYADWCECLGTPAEAAAMRRLLDQRNPVMAQRLDALLQGGARVFAAVGSLHMIGPHGLPALLAQRGYRVERIVFEAAALDVRTLWDFDDPARSEAVFRDALERSGGDAALVLRTQIARTLGLRRRFADGHAELDAVESALAGAGAEPRVRVALERGRLWRSAGEPARARPWFEQALAGADAARLPELAVDALHMIALLEPDTATQIATNERALARALASSDPRARRWEGSLQTNIGLTLMDAGRHAEALTHFRAALAVREREGARPDIRVARWMVAWALRHLGRHDEALELLRPLEREIAAAGTADGYVFEELGENLLALGRGDEARPWFAQAHARLSQEPEGTRPDDARLARLQQLAR